MESQLSFLVELLLWSTSIVLPASSLVAYHLPPVLSRLSVPPRATRSMFPSRPYHFLVSSGAVSPTFPFRPYCFSVSSRAVRRTFPPRPCHFTALSRAVCPKLPFVRPFFRCVVRYSFGVSSRLSRLPFCTVLRFLRWPIFLSFAWYYYTRQKTLLFGGLLSKLPY